MKIVSNVELKNSYLPQLAKAVTYDRISQVALALETLFGGYLLYSSSNLPQQLDSLRVTLMLASATTVFWGLSSAIKNEKAKAINRFMLSLGLFGMSNAVQNLSMNLKNHIQNKVPQNALKARLNNIEAQLDQFNQQLNHVDIRLNSLAAQKEELSLMPSESDQKIQNVKLSIKEDLRKIDEVYKNLTKNVETDYEILAAAYNKILSHEDVLGFVIDFFSSLIYRNKKT